MHAPTGSSVVLLFQEDYESQVRLTAQWCTSAIPPLEVRGKKDKEFKASLCLFLRKQKQNQTNDNKSQERGTKYLKPVLNIPLCSQTKGGYATVETLCQLHLNLYTMPLLQEQIQTERGGLHAPGDKASRWQSQG